MSSNDSSASGRKNQLEDLTSENIAQTTDADALFGAPSTLDMLDIPRHDLPLYPSVREQVSSAAITGSSSSASGRSFQSPPLPFQTFHAPPNLPVTGIVKSSMNPMNMSFSPFERYRDPDNPSRIKLPIPWLSSSRHAPMDSTRHLPTNITGQSPSPVRLAPPSQTISRKALSPPSRALVHPPHTSNSVVPGPLPLNTVYSTSASLTQSTRPVISEQQPRSSQTPCVQDSTAQDLVEVDHTRRPKPQPGCSDGLSVPGNWHDGTTNLLAQEPVGFYDQNRNTGISRISQGPTRIPSSSVCSQEWQPSMNKITIHTTPSL
ncbi:hypothetical protein AN958_06033 [Leucoagaricus sp. SymC.cos]|nr:hypothetical protein AN958_06033 [Leucoagaricus sp. SymC.cos]